MNQAADILIDRLGGTSAVAALCRIKPPSVAEWRIRGVPEARLLYLKALAETRNDIAEALDAAGFGRGLPEARKASRQDVA